MAASRLLLAALALALALPAAAAQGHEHGGAAAGLAIAHDGPADGRTFVGNVNHFAVLAHGGDGVPDFHQDVPWRVTLNGVTLVETTVSSGHDYDGVNAFDVVFPVPGTYTVEALDEGGNALVAFGGTVLPAPTVRGLVEVASAAPALPVAGQPFQFTYRVVADPASGGSGETIPHSDCTFEALKGGRTEVRTRTHTHEEEQSVSLAFAEAGTYLVRVTCFQAFPSPRAVLFVPAVHEQEVQVLPGPPANAGLAPPIPPPPAAINAVVTATAGDGTLLVGTFDPYTVVGPDTLQHLQVLAVDPATGVPRQHVDFTAVLDGPAGQVFASETLHEYDGILELTVRQSLPGPYTLRVTMEGADGTGELAMTYLVAPRAAPLNAGVVAVALDAAPVAGQAGEWLLSAGTTAGAFAHGELEILLHADGEPVPWLRAKLHTHDDGTYPFTVALPTEARHTLAAEPFPLTPDLVVVGAPSTFAVQASAGPAFPGAETTADAQAAAEAPAAPAALLLAGLALAAVALRRRA